MQIDKNQILELLRNQGDDAKAQQADQELPGTVDTHPNWRRRFALPAAQLLDDSDAARRLELLAQAREQIKAGE